MDYAVDKIKARIKELKLSDVTFLSKEIKALPEILRPDEVLLAATKGLYKNGLGLLCVTPQRILFIDKGIFSLNVEEFSLKAVSSISSKSGMLLAKINIYVSGNSAEVSQAPKADAKSFVDKVSKLLEENRIKQEPASTEAQATKPIIDTYDQLEKLGTLKAKGFITDEEFALEKSRLLSGSNDFGQGVNLPKNKQPEINNNSFSTNIKNENVTSYSQVNLSADEERRTKNNKIILPHNVTHENSSYRPHTVPKKKTSKLKVFFILSLAFIVLVIIIPVPETSTPEKTNPKPIAMASQPVENYYSRNSNSEDCKTDAVAISIQVHRNILLNRDHFSGVDLQSYKRKGCSEDLVKDAIRATLN